MITAAELLIASARARHYASGFGALWGCSENYDRADAESWRKGSQIDPDHGAPEIAVMLARGASDPYEILEDIERAYEGASKVPYVVELDYNPRMVAARLKGIAEVWE